MSDQDEVAAVLLVVPVLAVVLKLLVVLVLVVALCQWLFLPGQPFDSPCEQRFFFPCVVV